MNTEHQDETNYFLRVVHKTQGKQREMMSQCSAKAMTLMGDEQNKDVSHGFQITGCKNGRS